MSDKPSPKPASSRPAEKPAAARGQGPRESFDFLAPPQAPDELGRLAHYRVLKVLGKGGMGIVFMAEDTRLHRIAALKVMLPSIAKKAIARDRFIREARATAAIEHDHIVTIYEVNEDNEVPYLAMQFLKGMSLEDWLKAGKTLNIPQLMRIGKEIAKALAAAHSHKLIHRDIKPSNIWLDAVNKGRVKILDFGLARPTNEETHLTQEGMILGSPAYMSPEQARGHNVDERCDLFSLGCVLYRLCAGKLPFTGKDAMSMLLSITTDEPPDLVKLHDELPPAFAELVHKLLAKKPEDRPASAKDVVQTIQAIERDWIASARTSQFRSKPDAVATTQGATVAADKEDPALEESAITDLELQETSSPRTAPRSSSRSWIFAGLGCSVLTAASMACCVIVMVAFNQGEVKVIPEDEVARAKLGEIHLVVHDHNKKPFPLDLDEPTPLPAGGYEFDLEKLPKDLQFEPSKFVLRTKMTLEIKVRYVPLKPAYELLTSDRAKEYQRKWAAYLKCPVVETNTLKAKLALIPPGEFLMGSTDKEIEKHVADLGSRKFEKKLLPAGYFTRVNHEKPAHRVQISKPIYMGVHEVTFGEFVDFVKKNGYTASQSGTGLEAGKELREPDTYSYLAFGPAYTPKNNHPVSNVAWRDVDAFCKWLSKTEKKTYRLPTEAEWEYACRAGSAALWSCGNDSRETHQREHMWFHVPFKFGDNPRTPEVVGQKAANQFGLHDMHGNVAEMCADLWAADYYQRSAKEKLTIDPKGPEPGVSGRVVRGGSFLDMAPLVRSAYRQYQDPGQARASLGFRIVCEVPMTAE